MAVPPKEHETVPAPEVVFPAILDPVFAFPGKSELFANALSLRARNEAYHLIRFFSRHRSGPALSAQIIKTPVKDRGSVNKEDLSLIVISSARYPSSSYHFLYRR